MNTHAYIGTTEQDDAKIRGPGTSLPFHFWGGASGRAGSNDPHKLAS